MSTGKANGGLRMVSSRVMRAGGLEDGCLRRTVVQDGRPRGAERHARGMWVWVASVDRLRVCVYETFGFGALGVSVR